MRPTLILALTSLALLACGGGDEGDDDDDDDTPDAPAAIDAAAADAADPRPVVVLSTTLGDLVVRLEPDLMPVTTANFLAYVDDGFFDGTLVHRVIDDWVIQGGGYTTGLAPKSPTRAPIPLETSSLVTHVHGAISMARTSDPDSATTQWFIVDWPVAGTPPQPGSLDGNYAAFGVTIEGLDVLEAITQVATTSSGGLDDVPVTEVVVTSASRR